MRKIIIAAILASTAAGAAQAQTLGTLDNRLNKLEREVRAVQRKVFPGGNDRFFEPEIQTPAPGAVDDNGGFGVGAATPTAVFTERLNALESQVQNLTGQVEEMNFKMRQMQERLASFESDTKFRLQTLEGNGGEGALDFEGGGGSPSAGGPDGQYAAAYSLYEEKDFSGAQSAFTAFMEANPEHEKASAAGYWIGRSLLQQDQPVQAVQAFLSNYQERRDGVRAPDSLLWVGRSLMQIEPPRREQACQAYDRLETEYEGKMSNEVVSGLVEARMEADCS